MALRDLITVCTNNFTTYFRLAKRTVGDAMLLCLFFNFRMVLEIVQDKSKNILNFLLVPGAVVYEIVTKIPFSLLTSTDICVWSLSTHKKFPFHEAFIDE